MHVLGLLVLGIEFFELFKEKVERLGSLGVHPIWLWYVVFLDEAELLEEIRVFGIEKLILLVCGGDRLINPLIISPLSDLWWDWCIVPLDLWVDWHSRVLVPVLNPVVFWIVDEVVNTGDLSGVDGVGNISGVVVGVVGIVVVGVLEPVVVVWRWVHWVDSNGLGTEHQEGSGEHRSHF